MNKESLMQKYLSRLGDPHNKYGLINRLDFGIRQGIGKTDDIEKLKAGACSHQAILERERDLKGKNPENYCRKCGVELGVGVGRVNDYLVLRNPFCRSAICLDCVKKGGDVFYHSFRKGVEYYNTIVGKDIEDLFD